MVNVHIPRFLEMAVDNGYVSYELVLIIFFKFSLEKLHFLLNPAAKNMTASLYVKVYYMGQKSSYSLRALCL